LVIETPDCTGVRSIESRSDYSKVHPLEHINGFTPSTLKAFATRIGFACIPKPVVFVTGDYRAVMKTIAKRLLKPVFAETTQMYFRKL
jgi:hypothetical protein